MNYKPSDVADVRVLGLKGKDVIVFWVQDKRSDWQNARLSIESEVLSGISFDILNCFEGRYSAEWFDTYIGKTIKTEVLYTIDKRLHVLIPTFRRDIACVLKRVT